MNLNGCVNCTKYNVCSVLLTFLYFLRTKPKVKCYSCVKKLKFFLRNCNFCMLFYDCSHNLNNY